MSGCKEFAFNFNGKQEERVGFSSEDSVELKEGEILQKGDFRFSTAFGWVLIEVNLIGTEVPKKPRYWIKAKKRGTGYLRPKKNVQK
ncbi:MAG: hypothetical protein L3J07_04205 [Candidatus Magasanikbacteria bacterium]|nr:hypothetical protein [Candidatus Magasanikbacteria bacterium]